MTAAAAFHVAACVNEFCDICFSMFESPEKSSENCREMERGSAADAVSVSYPVEWFNHFNHFTKDLTNSIFNQFCHFPLSRLASLPAVFPSAVICILFDLIFENQRPPGKTPAMERSINQAADGFQQTVVISPLLAPCGKLKFTFHRKLRKTFYGKFVFIFRWRTLGALTRMNRLASMPWKTLFAFTHENGKFSNAIRWFGKWKTLAETNI